jgi:hypothetical protein
MSKTGYLYRTSGSVVDNYGLRLNVPSEAIDASDPITADLSALFTSISGANNIYVSKAGSDSNSGTILSPVRTLAKAVEIVPVNGKIISSCDLTDEQSVTISKELSIEGNKLPALVVNAEVYIQASLVSAIDVTSNKLFANILRVAESGVFQSAVFEAGVFEDILVDNFNVIVPTGGQIVGVIAGNTYQGV